MSTDLPFCRAIWENNEAVLLIPWRLTSCSGNECTVISATASSLTMQETSASAPSSAVWELGYADITKHSVQNYFKNMKIYIDVDKYVREHVFWRDEAAPIIPRRIWESMCVVRWLIGDLETLLDLFFQRESSPGVRSRRAGKELRATIVYFISICQ